jgi:hypothetical protein
MKHENFKFTALNLGVCSLGCVDQDVTELSVIHHVSAEDARDLITASAIQAGEARSAMLVSKRKKEGTPY